MKYLRRQALNWIAIFALIIVGGCAGPPKIPIYLAPGFEISTIDEIGLLPAIDSRIDKTEDVDVQRLLHDDVKEVLEDKGYKITSSTAIDSAAGFSDVTLKSGNADWIRRLPSDRRWVMILVLADVETKLTFGSTGNAEVAGYLYDKVNGTVAWRDKGIGKIGQGGLIGMMLKGLMAESAISVAMTNLVASIPERPDQ